MIVFFVLSIFGQNGFQYMLEASPYGCFDTICNPSRSSYINMDSILNMRLRATNMAKHMVGDSEMLYLAKNSNDPTHRVAAAFAHGMRHSANDHLFELALDKNNIVSQAAREALIFIATTKRNKKGVDFGPFPTDDFSHKEDAVKLWKLFFIKNDPACANCNNKNKESLKNLIKTY